MTPDRKAILVVGGASGIGQALVRGFGQGEYAVTVWDSRPGTATEPSVIDRRTIDIGDRAAVLAALAALGYADEDALAAAIRAGELDGRDTDVMSCLRELVRHRLAIAHPGYAAQT